MTAAARVRQRPEVRRAMIVEAARAVIVRNGVGATGLRDIAAEAGVSVGTVTYHFGSVAEILNEVVVLETERFYGAIVAAVDAEPDVLAGLRMLVAPLFGDTEQVRQHWRIWSDYWTAVVRRPEVAAEYAERIRVWEACLVRVIRRGVHSGVFRHAVEPDTVALQLAAYSDGVATQIAQGVPGLTNTVALSWMWRFLSHELGVPAVDIAGTGRSPL
ncbi:TetR/AcrR family transcriptional regulator [Curtobacterium aurantiacum]|uniref:TetR family transcriptional regulator C-terminal domain-containing protein n=1 Tax=Curtobacterium aurantiacum TaxID=3236919 RepID=A0ABS5VFD4_9MICO|nr:TetR family transcriptional regulator C-terminal domain-containing protein [Curtobacterium flaccumfaciens]MBT1544731.1 TetR family transcriptional regulator C-terminal domain-containing protein [Curtobacterium flaccumfaciens pv. flaccumfaciens]MBT1587817.1 TetR family transcriptional regulator C-terminal domain-containing protein [Curtobacterium flaccumfaciens pv. flaccumfaciens]MBT1676661.1 TetR family transcriptional regulator C-terminal domain-containing protein [Curtobacterium flaccumfaci